VNESLRVTKGSPDGEELTAVVMALDMVAARPLSSEPAAASKWKSSLRGPGENATCQYEHAQESAQESIHALTTLSRGCSRG
jgi:hypothetical protein